ICGAASSSASVVPAPIRLLSMPRGTIPRTSTSTSARRIPSRRSGTTSVPPESNNLSLAESSSARLDGRRSSTLLPAPRRLECAQQLLPRDRQLVDVRAGRVADRVRDRGGDRHDRRLSETLRAEARQVLVRLVDELAHDLGNVGDRRHAVGVECRREDPTRLRIVQALLRERVPDPLDDPAFDLAPRTEGIDDPADVVRRRDTLDAHLAGLDVDGDLDDLD